MKVKIYNNEHHGWWNEDFLGYTKNEKEAGVFDYNLVTKIYPELKNATIKSLNYLVKVKVDIKQVIKECIDLLRLEDAKYIKQVVINKLENLLNDIEDDSSKKAIGGNN